MEHDLRAFTNEAVTAYGARDIASELSGGKGELWFKYEGSAAPSVIQDLARRHNLEIVQCGATLISTP